MKQYKVKVSVDDHQKKKKDFDNILIILIVK